MEDRVQRPDAIRVERDRVHCREADEAERRRRWQASAVLVRAADPHLRWLSDALLPRSHALWLADRDGVVVCARGPEADALPAAPVGVPIRDPNGAIAGALGLATASGDAERALGLAVAHAAHAIELTLAQGADADAATRAVERARRLETLMTALARARSVPEVAEAMLHDTREALDAAAGAVYLVDGDALALVAHDGAGSIAPRLPRLPLDEPLQVCDAVRRREAVWLHSREEALAAYPRIAELAGIAELEALLAAPLLVGDGCVGVVAFRFAQPRLFNEDERRFVVTASAACAQALDRACAQRREEDALAGRLRRVEGWLGRIYDSPLVGIVVTDGRRVLEANDAFLDLLGYARDELVRGLDWRRITAPESRVDDEHAFAAARVHGWCAPYEKEYLRSDGTRVPVLVGAARLDDGQLACIVVDNRPRQEAERFQRHVVGIVSHDLRNPIAAIELSAHAQRTRATDPIVLKLADNIVSACRTMHQIVGDLLDYARTRSGGIPIQRRRCNVDDVCQEVVARCRQAFPGHVIACHGFGPGEGSWDSGRLVQLVTNLVTNALKHGAPDAPVTVEWVQSDEGLTIEVHNEGEPIPPAQLPSLFEPFQRGRREPGGDRGGSIGLGLYIVRAIACAHGGSVAVRSTAEDGTTFTVKLPA